MVWTCPDSSSSIGSSLITISVSGRTWTMPFGLVETIANGRASANSVMPGMNMRSPATTGRLFRPRRAKPSMPGPKRTFCCLAITGLSTRRWHGWVSTLVMLTLSPRLTPAFFLMIPSILITPRLASSGRQRQTMAAVRDSPVISTMSPGLRLSSLSNGTRARP